MTPKQIEDIITTFNSNKLGCNTGNHVSLFECVQIGGFDRVILWLHDSGSKMTGIGDAPSRYRCDIKTENGIPLLRDNRHHEDPKTAIVKTLKKFPSNPPPKPTSTSKN